MTASAVPVPPHPSNGSLTWLPTREDVSLILEASAEAIFMTDQNGRILFLNPAAQ